MHGTIDSAVAIPGRGIHVFAGDQVWRYHHGHRRPAPGYPRPITAEFPGIFARGIDAAFVHPDGDLHLFRGNHQIRYDLAAGKPRIGYPRPYARDWTGVFPDRIDAALTWSPDVIYLFSGNRYTSFSPLRSAARPGFPKPIAGGWPGIGAGPVRAALALADGSRILLADANAKACDRNGQEIELPLELEPLMAADGPRAAAPAERYRPQVFSMGEAAPVHAAHPAARLSWPAARSAVPRLKPAPWRGLPAGWKSRPAATKRTAHESLDRTETTRLDWLPPMLSESPSDAAGTRKRVVLVAGHDYERSGADFGTLALNRMKLLIGRHQAAHRAANSSLAQMIDSAPRFVLFDVEAGTVRQAIAGGPKGQWAWSDVATFKPVSVSNYSHGGRRFDTAQAGTLSITDVYDHVRGLGRTEAGSVAELSFLSHGWIGGPILVNSFDHLTDSDNARDPDDRDGRASKDFIAPTMPPSALDEFRAAFADDGIVWVWGCVFARSAHQVVHQVLANVSRRKTTLEKLADAGSFHFSFSRADADKFFAVDPSFFPQKEGDKFVLDFDRSFGDVKAFLRGRLSETYCQAIANASQRVCIGALPGTYADYERGVTLPVMVVPTRHPPYDDDFTNPIRVWTTCLGRTLDPEGRHYGRYEP